MNTNNLRIDEDTLKEVDRIRKEKIKKAKNLKYQQESLGASLLLNSIFEDNYFLDISGLEYTYNEHGKPFLKDSALCFSISHCNGIVAVAVEKNNIGIDIEEILPHKTKVDSVLFNEEEMNYYNSLNKNEKEKYFYETWCAKEAYTKCIGTGITVHPKEIAIDQDVVTRTFVMNDRNFMIAACGMESFRIIERYIPREYLIKNK